MKALPFILVFVMISSCLLAQVPTGGDSIAIDTTARPAEVIFEDNENVDIKEIDTYADQFVPRKASLYSAIVPGGGQVYNKKYWKLPIVYGGFVALGFAVDFYNDRYKLLRSEYFRTISEPGYQSVLGNKSQLNNRLDSERRDRDFYVIMIGVLYLLQIADAHIDAHLKEFDLNPDLQVSIEPSFSTDPYGHNAGLSLKIRF